MNTMKEKFGLQMVIEKQENIDKKIFNESECEEAIFNNHRNNYLETD